MNSVAGSVGIGWLAVRYRMKLLLAALYAVRALAIVTYQLTPKDARDHVPVLGRAGPDPARHRAADRRAGR
jgi:hypothetical protein